MAWLRYAPDEATVVSFSKRLMHIQPTILFDGEQSEFPMNSRKLGPGEIVFIHLNL